MANYIAMKASIFKNQDKSGYSIINADNPITAAMAEKTPGRPIFFSHERELDEGVFLSDGFICAKLCGIEEKVAHISRLGIVGPHNIENAMAACAAAICAGVPVDAIRSALKKFRAVEHRLEFVRELDGVRYFNDSKATNVDAAIKAVSSFDRPLLLIAGGRAKTDDFAEWVQIFPEKAKLVVCIGEAGAAIARECESQGYTSVESASTMREAVDFCKKKAVPGDCVLLSPACASFDMFESYEQRGNVFKKIVFDLN